MSGRRGRHFHPRQIYPPRPLGQQFEALTNKFNEGYFRGNRMRMLRGGPGPRYQARMARAERFIEASAFPRQRPVQEPEQTVVKDNITITAENINKTGLTDTPRTVSLQENAAEEPEDEKEEGECEDDEGEEQSAQGERLVIGVNNSSSDTASADSNVRSVLYLSEQTAGSSSAMSFGSVQVPSSVLEWDSLCGGFDLSDGSNSGSEHGDEDAHQSRIGSRQSLTEDRIGSHSKLNRGKMKRHSKHNKKPLKTMPLQTMKELHKDLRVLMKKHPENLSFKKYERNLKKLEKAVVKKVGKTMSENQVMIKLTGTDGTPMEELNHLKLKKYNILDHFGRYGTLHSCDDIFNTMQYFLLTYIQMNPGYKLDRGNSLTKITGSDYGYEVIKSTLPDVTTPSSSRTAHTVTSEYQSSSRSLGSQMETEDQSWPKVSEHVGSFQDRRCLLGDYPGSHVPSDRSATSQSSSSHFGTSPFDLKHRTSRSAVAKLPHEPMSNAKDATSSSDNTTVLPGMLPLSVMRSIPPPAIIRNRNLLPSVQEHVTNQSIITSPVSEPSDHENRRVLEIPLDRLECGSSDRLDRRSSDRNSETAGRRSSERPWADDGMRIRGLRDKSHEEDRRSSDLNIDDVGRRSSERPRANDDTRLKAARDERYGEDRLRCEDLTPLRCRLTEKKRLRDICPRVSRESDRSSKEAFGNSRSMRLYDNQSIEGRCGKLRRLSYSNDRRRHLSAESHHDGDARRRRHSSGESYRDDHTGRRRHSSGESHRDDDTGRRQRSQGESHRDSDTGRRQHSSGESRRDGDYRRRRHSSEQRHRDSNNGRRRHSSGERYRDGDNRRRRHSSGQRHRDSDIWRQQSSAESHRDGGNNRRRRRSSAENCRDGDNRRRRPLSESHRRSGSRSSDLANTHRKKSLSGSQEDHPRRSSASVSQDREERDQSRRDHSEKRRHSQVGATESYSAKKKKSAKPDKLQARLLHLANYEDNEMETEEMDPDGPLENDETQGGSSYLRKKKRPADQSHDGDQVGKRRRPAPTANVVEEVIDLADSDGDDVGEDTSAMPDEIQIESDNASSDECEVLEEFLDGRQIHSQDRGEETSDVGGQSTGNQSTLEPVLGSGGRRLLSCLGMRTLPEENDDQIGRSTNSDGNSYGEDNRNTLSESGCLRVISRHQLMSRSSARTSSRPGSKSSYWSRSRSSSKNRSCSGSSVRSRSFSRTRSRSSSMSSSRSRSRSKSISPTIEQNEISPSRNTSEEPDQEHVLTKERLPDNNPIVEIISIEEQEAHFKEVGSTDGLKDPSQEGPSTSKVSKESSTVATQGNLRKEQDLTLSKEVSTDKPNHSMDKKASPKTAQGDLSERVDSALSNKASIIISTQSLENKASSKNVQDAFLKEVDSAFSNRASTTKSNYSLEKEASPKATLCDLPNHSLEKEASSKAANCDLPKEVDSALSNKDSITISTLSLEKDATPKAVSCHLPKEIDSALSNKASITSSTLSLEKDATPKAVNCDLPKDIDFALSNKASFTISTHSLEKEASPKAVHCDLPKIVDIVLPNIASTAMSKYSLEKEASPKALHCDLPKEVDPALSDKASTVNPKHSLDNKASSKAVLDDDSALSNEVSTTKSRYSMEIKAASKTALDDLPKETVTSLSKKDSIMKHKHSVDNKTLSKAVKGNLLKEIDFLSNTTNFKQFRQSLKNEASSKSVMGNLSKGVDSSLANKSSITKPKHSLERKVSSKGVQEDLPKKVNSAHSNKASTTKSKRSLKKKASSKAVQGDLPEVNSDLANKASIAKQKPKQSLERKASSKVVQGDSQKETTTFSKKVSTTKSKQSMDEKTTSKNVQSEHTKEADAALTNKTTNTKSKHSLETKAISKDVQGDFSKEVDSTLSKKSGPTKPKESLKEKISSKNVQSDHALTTKPKHSLENQDSIKAGMIPGVQSVNSLSAYTSIEENVLSKKPNTSSASTKEAKSLKIKEVPSKKVQQSECHEGADQHQSSSSPSAIPAKEASTSTNEMDNAMATHDSGRKSRFPNGKKNTSTNKSLFEVDSKVSSRSSPDLDSKLTEACLDEGKNDQHGDETSKISKEILTKRQTSENQNDAKAENPCQSKDETTSRPPIRPLITRRAYVKVQNWLKSHPSCAKELATNMMSESTSSESNKALATDSVEKWPVPMDTVLGADEGHDRGVGDEAAGTGKDSPQADKKQMGDSTCDEIDTLEDALTLTRNLREEAILKASLEQFTKFVAKYRLPLVKGSVSKSKVAERSNADESDASEVFSESDSDNSKASVSVTSSGSETSDDEEVDGETNSSATSKKPESASSEIDLCESDGSSVVEMVEEGVKKKESPLRSPDYASPTNSKKKKESPARSSDYEPPTNSKKKESPARSSDYESPTNSKKESQARSPDYASPTNSKKNEYLPISPDYAPPTNFKEENEYLPRSPDYAPPTNSNVELICLSDSDSEFGLYSPPRPIDDELGK